MSDIKTVQALVSLGEQAANALRNSDDPLFKVFVMAMDETTTKGHALIAQMQRDAAGIQNVRDTLIRAGEKSADAQRMAEEGWREMQRDAVQPGWKLVPVEPTPEMLKAWINEPQRVPAHELDELGELRDMAFCYRAMLAAAPQPAGTQSDAERASFEAWAKRKYGPNAALFTNTDRTNVAWEVWQAARAHAPEPQQDDHAGSPAPIRSLAEFCAEAKRTGLTAATLAQALSKRPEFADCLPSAESSKAALSDEEIDGVELPSESRLSVEPPKWWKREFARAILSRAGIGESRHE